VIPDYIAGQFSPVKRDADAGMQHYHASRWSIFSQRQRVAIAAYLREYSASGLDPCFTADVDRVVLRLEAHETAA
jgi:hypothetical protein